MPLSTSTFSSAEATEKREAVLEAASRRRFSGVVATEASTVRWLLCGRGRPVVFGAASYVVVVGEDGTTVLHPDIESSRVTAEERFDELGVRVETFPWHEGPDAVLRELAGGLAAEDELADEVGALRRELRPEELERYRAAARDTAEAMVEALEALAPETSEQEAAAALGSACLDRGLSTPRAPGRRRGPAGAAPSSNSDRGAAWSPRAARRDRGTGRPARLDHAAALLR